MWPSWTCNSLISFVLGALRGKTPNSVSLYKALIQIFKAVWMGLIFSLYPCRSPFFPPALSRISSGLRCICPLLFAKSKWNAVLFYSYRSPCSTAKAEEFWECSPLGEGLPKVFSCWSMYTFSSSAVYQDDNSSFLNKPKKELLGFKRSVSFSTWSWQLSHRNTGWTEESFFLCLNNAFSPQLLFMRSLNMSLKLLGIIWAWIYAVQNQGRLEGVHETKHHTTLWGSFPSVIDKYLLHAY